jgi:serine/threonine-protein kinase RsbW
MPSAPKENKRITVSCSRENLKLIRQFVAEELAPYKLPDLVQNQIILAVDEICANLIIHSNHEDNRKAISLATRMDSDTFVVDICDQGEAYLPQNYLEPQLPELIRQKRKGGVGMLLVKRMMDKVEYFQAGQTNVVRLTKRLD